ncbi:polypyrimidine tract-binding protein 1 [Prunus dulcis]|uniref:Polypyrimidine tract-binding protein 1 n=1 Tax=Prunus dulcis TaxID=3755 RepID=A0A4Y1R810_PRUDU|nr:polypyrimidine tract-binding protein 1 [Prunus dulcis]
MTRIYPSIINKILIRRPTSHPTRSSQRPNPTFISFIPNPHFDIKSRTISRRPNTLSPVSNPNPNPQSRILATQSRRYVDLGDAAVSCAEEELIELCKPFGKIVNTKCNVGANRNQAFVEFADLNQAINMVSYYASSSEPAQVRGKTVYIQYSNRHEIVNNKSPGDVPGNVLLVTIEGVEAGDVSIDVIHLVFSAFGFVHKIATFEKAAGFQALIQFNDAETASSARNALDGRSIPRHVLSMYLLPEHVGSCHLRISYSAHTDLNIKFQSHRSRDYTNPYLPVNPTAIEGIMQPAVGPDGKKKELESNVLLASIENMQYAVTVDVLHTVFSAFGTVQKIAIFEKNGQTQALVQYPDVNTAAVAREALEGHCIYDGGYCKLHLSYSRHTDLNVKAFSDKSRDYTIQKLVCLRRSKFLVTLLLQQLGRIPRLLQCTMGTSSVVQLLCRPKGLRGKGHHGIQPCRRADQRLFQFRARFLVKHFMHPQVQYIPLQQCRQVLHLSKQAQLLPPVWLLGEYLSQVVAQLATGGGASPPGVGPPGASPSYYGQ